MTKRKKKIALPKDRNGVPINIGDWVMFSDGPFHVDLLIYYGPGFDVVTTNGWTARDEDEEESDNLKAGEVVTLKGGKKWKASKGR